MAFVQLKAGALASAEAIIDFARQRIQERAAVPVEIVILDEIPMTAVGKVSKPPLRLEAIRRVVAEAAARLSPDTRVQIEVTEIGGRPVAALSAASALPESLREELARFTFTVAVNGNPKTRSPLDERS